MVSYSEVHGLKRQANSDLSTNGSYAAFRWPVGRQRKVFSASLKVLQHERFLALEKV